MITPAMRKLDGEAVAEAVSAVARAFGVAAGQLLAHRRTPEICDARHALCRILREETDGTFHGIARHLNRDHGAIIHSAKRAGELVEIDPRYAAKYEAALAAFLGPEASATPAAPTPARRSPWPWLP